MGRKSFKPDQLMPGKGRGLDILIPTEEATADTPPAAVRTTAKRRGRPRINFREIEKSSQEGTKEGESRATYIVREDLQEKIKAMALWESFHQGATVTIKEIVNAAFQEAVERFEKKNGPLKPLSKNQDHAANS